MRWVCSHRCLVGPTHFKAAVLASDGLQAEQELRALLQNRTSDCDFLAPPTLVDLSSRIGRQLRGVAMDLPLN